jgi:hypothetical protein
MRGLSKWLIFLPLALVGGLSGCGTAGGGSSAPSPGNSGNVTAFIQDAPVSPAGGASSPSISDAPSFGVDVSGAALSGSGSNASLLSSVQSVELRHLDLASTMMSGASVIPGDAYTGLALTLANPRLIVMNSQGQPTRLDGTTSPSVRLAQSGLTIPLSVTVPTNGQVGLEIRFDVQSSISLDSSGNYVISPVVNASVIGSAPSDDQLVGAVGTIKALSSSPQPEITLLLAKTQQTAQVLADSTTRWSAGIGQFSNLQVGQNIFVNAQFQSGGTYLASFVGPAAANLSLSFEGVLTALGQDSSGNTTLSLAVQN